MRAVLAVSTALLLGAASWVFAGCDDSLAGDTPPADDDAGEGGKPYEGPAKGGAPINEGGSGPIQPIGDDSGPLVIDKRCCNLTFRLDDPTQDESVAVLKGDFAPLDGKGVKLTWSGDVDAGTGEWRAAACIPIGAYVRYAFYFGQPSDDGGAPESRVNADQPTVPDGLGGSLNAFGPVSSCADADASTGMTP